MPLVPSPFWDKNTTSIRTSNVLCVSPIIRFPSTHIATLRACCNLDCLETKYISWRVETKTAVLCQFMLQEGKFNMKTAQRGYNMKEHR